jgi:hypothetical protein
VVGMTYSEFGRRIRSNAALGTDHGTAAPVFLFGTCIQKQILGDHPVIDTQVGIDEGVPMQYDFRDIYGTILKDWLGLNTLEISNVLHPNVQTLPLFKNGCITSLSSNQDFTKDKFQIKLYPNPASSIINIEFYNIGEGTQIRVFDGKGAQLESLKVQSNSYQNRTFQLNISNYPVGSYFIHIQNNFVNETKKFIKNN